MVGTIFSSWKGPGKSEWVSIFICNLEVQEWIWKIMWQTRWTKAMMDRVWTAWPRRRSTVTQLLVFRNVHAKEAFLYMSHSLSVLHPKLRDHGVCHVMCVCVYICCVCFVCVLFVAIGVYVYGVCVCLSVFCNSFMCFSFLEGCIQTAGSHLHGRSLSQGTVGRVTQRPG